MNVDRTNEQRTKELAKERTMHERKNSEHSIDQSLGKYATSLTSCLWARSCQFRRCRPRVVVVVVVVAAIAVIVATAAGATAAAIVVVVVFVASYVTSLTSCV